MPIESYGPIERGKQQGMLPLSSFMHELAMDKYLCDNLRNALCVSILREGHE